MPLKLYWGKSISGLIPYVPHSICTSFHMYLIPYVPHSICTSFHMYLIPYVLHYVACHIPFSFPIEREASCHISFANSMHAISHSDIACFTFCFECVWYIDIIELTINNFFLTVNNFSYFETDWIALIKNLYFKILRSKFWIMKISIAFYAWKRLNICLYVHFVNVLEALIIKCFTNKMFQTIVQKLLTSSLEK